MRFLAHAGTDVESGYRSPAAIAADRARDPLLALARRIGGGDLAARYEAIAELVATAADEVADAPTLRTAAEVRAPLAPPPAAAGAGRHGPTRPRGRGRSAAAARARRGR